MAASCPNSRDPIRRQRKLHRDPPPPRSPCELNSTAIPTSPLTQKTKTSLRPNSTLDTGFPRARGHAAAQKRPQTHRNAPTSFDLRRPALPSTGDGPRSAAVRADFNCGFLLASLSFPLIHSYLKALRVQLSEPYSAPLLNEGDLPFGPCFQVLYDRDTGRSRGFAFVTMSSVEDCEQVMNNLDGAQFGGRTMKVNFADKPKPKEPLYPETEHKLFVGNLSWSVTSEVLTEVFQEHGNVVGA
ncbi:hypothetical protein ZIOFF_053480 [Zingiber officinale]|uniref:RRM domain-containing protein n=1 Tax=Zingiber officinale TaxID=94328 RepID=A0A8J5KQ02_ZINOF|nr:hypothetical protein ZIOFF_053480 [Zingiber officinale]